MFYQAWDSNTRLRLSLGGPGGLPVPGSPGETFPRLYLTGRDGRILGEVGADPTSRVGAWAYRNILGGVDVISGSTPAQTTLNSLRLTAHQLTDVSRPGFGRGLPTAAFGARIFGGVAGTALSALPPALENPVVINLTTGENRHGVSFEWDLVLLKLFEDPVIDTSKLYTAIGNPIPTEPGDVLMVYTHHLLVSLNVSSQDVLAFGLQGYENPKINGVSTPNARELTYISANRTIQWDADDKKYPLPDPNARSLLETNTRWQILVYDNTIPEGEVIGGRVITEEDSRIYQTAPDKRGIQLRDIAMVEIPLGITDRIPAIELITDTENRSIETMLVPGVDYCITVFAVQNPDATAGLLPPVGSSVLWTKRYEFESPAPAARSDENGRDPISRTTFRYQP